MIECMGVCGRVFIQNESFQLIKSRHHQIVKAIELEDREKIADLQSFLTADDIKKIEDFTFNRWRPEPRPVSI